MGNARLYTTAPSVTRNVAGLRLPLCGVTTMSTCLSERDEETHEARDRERAEVAAQHFRHVGLADAEQFGGIDILQSATWRRPRVVIRPSMR